MLLHHETYRILVDERLNHYLREAAADRRTRIAAVPRERGDARSGSTAAARLLRAVVRAAGATYPREEGSVWGDRPRCFLSAWITSSNVKDGTSRCWTR
jgi:hypothetical protein